MSEQDKMRQKLVGSIRKTKAATKPAAAPAKPKAAKPKAAKASPAAPVQKTASRPDPLRSGGGGRVWPD